MVGRSGYASSKTMVERMGWRDWLPRREADLQANGATGGREIELVEVIFWLNPARVTEQL